MRRVITGYELQPDGFWTKVSDHLVESIDNVEQAYAYDKKGHNLYVRTATSNCVVTLTKEYAELVKNNKYIPKLKEGEIDMRVLQVNSVLEEKYTALNDQRRAHINDSIAKVRADSLEQVRQDSLRRVREAEEASRYRLDHDWQWLFDEGLTLPCTLCDESFTVKDSVMCMSVRDSVLYYGETVGGELGLSFTKLHATPITDELLSNHLLKIHLLAFSDSLTTNEGMEPDMVEMLNSMAYLDYIEALKSAAPYGYVDSWNWRNDSVLVFFYEYMNLSEKTITSLDLSFSVTDINGKPITQGNFKTDCDIPYMNQSRLEWDTSKYALTPEAAYMTITKLVIIYADGTKKTLGKDDIVYDE